MKTNTGKVRKRKSSETKRRKLRGSVMKMLAVMGSNPESIKDQVTEFLVTGRTGRRNAMPDILGPNATVTSSDLPQKLEMLTTVDSEAGPSSTPPQKVQESNTKEVVEKENDRKDSPPVKKDG
ncbi:cAMP-dependent protein kinase inhibitor beta, putative [Pediculus humanus corporis]|uniref:cAMP-dependent protein kinase inhibitor beta, putative n=1 Tax=Pediculus humanus subsp. corporis TaxID=121224 RepID=E0VWN9_PEDHC|nr:cAMP-dependent protein kinase inhibitor beta, putative [Pediculus humanus corporis]EEB17795.1 cAMP-dependent protein kinase inhibitor beta, putative [Pediculus humanus corporis]